MDKASAFKSRVITFPPHPVRGRPGLYRVWFMAHRESVPNEMPTSAGLTEAMLVVDSAGEGAVIEHQKLDPPLADLDPLDFELRALELVRAQAEIA